MPPIETPYALGGANEPIRLYRGAGTLLRSDGNSVSGPTALDLALLPSPRLAFELEAALPPVGSNERPSYTLSLNEIDDLPPLNVSAHVICFLEDIYTPAERTLVEAGELEAVRGSRHAFQRAMESRFVDAVEGTTGRTVRAFLSQTHIAPDISCEVFVLEPTGSEPADRGDA
jgi:hypothetical protein